MQASVSNQKALRVLLLEDDEVDRRAICSGLRKSFVAFDYDHAERLSDVDKLLKDNHFDVVLADMNLPDSVGLDTITSLLELVEATPIVVLSGNDNDTVALEAVHAGAEDYISKNYIDDGCLIGRTLRHAVERHQLMVGLQITRDRERFLAHYDQCTSLPNRLLFLDRLQQATAQARRNRETFTIFLVNLDRFKLINDSFGQSAGDEVLRCVSERMTTLVRESDTVARFGGDEFTLILQKSANDKAMEHLADKLIDAINRPVPFGHRQGTVGASIGIASYPKHGDSPESLLKNADMAMYDAKHNGRNQCQIFTPALAQKKSLFFSLEKALREAAKKPEAHFELHYQPRVELKTGKVRAVEALIRWHHKDLGDVTPGQFLPLAEDLGLIGQIDEWVLDRACRQSLQWQAQGEDIPIAINISGPSFTHRSFVNRVIEPALKRYRLDGKNLEIEITERILLAESKRTLQRLEELKSLGFGLTIDDFGSGFSSLNYLKRFPIDALKIDGSFMCDDSSSDDEKSLLNAIIALGKALNMTMIAECVETEAQRNYLSKLHCDEGQGFHWARPSAQWLPPKDVAPPIQLAAYKEAQSGNTTKRQ